MDSSGVRDRPPAESRGVAPWLYGVSSREASTRSPIATPPTGTWQTKSNTISSRRPPSILPEDLRRPTRGAPPGWRSAIRPSLREEVRSSGWEHTIETLTTDLRYAARRLRRSPGFACVAIVTLGLGIGASTSVFSAANPILFERLPYPQAQRIVTIWEERKDGGRLASTFGAYRAMVERCHAFEALAVMRAWQPTLIGGSQPERSRVSASVRRTFGRWECRRRSAATFWTPRTCSTDLASPSSATACGAAGSARDPAILGRQITLDDISYTDRRSDAPAIRERPRSGR